jgi:hypothetical protein
MLLVVRTCCSNDQITRGFTIDHAAPAAIEVAPRTLSPCSDDTAPEERDVRHADTSRLRLMAAFVRR